MQALSLIVLFPLILVQRGIGMADMPSFISSGFSAFCGVGEEGMMKLLPAVGVVWNIAFNIVVLSAIRSVGIANVVVAMTAAVPLAVFAFTLPLPVIGSAPLPGKFFIPGTILLMTGQLAYNWISIKTVLFGSPSDSPKGA